jgi:hypothetical protein
VPPAWVSNEDVEAYLQKRFRDLPFAVPLAQAIDNATKREEDFLRSITANAGEIEPTSSARKVKPVPSVVVGTNVKQAPSTSRSRSSKPKV